MSRYLHNLAVWCSQSAHVWLFPRTGNPDLTISARAHIEAEVYGHPGWTRARNIINRIFRWENDHCALSFAADVRHAERVTAYQSRLEDQA